MGNKALIRLTILLAVVGAVALIVKLTGMGTVDRGGSASGTSSGREFVIEKFPLTQVARVRLRSSEGEINLVKGESNWQVAERGNHPADGEAVATLLQSASRLKIRQRPAINSSSFDSISLLDPAKPENLPEQTALILSFLDGEGKELDSLWLGKPYENSESQPSPFGPSSNEAGRYVMRGGEEQVFLVEETFDAAKTDPTEWLDEEFFKIEKIQTIEIKSGDPKEDWKLSRKEATGDFTLADAKAGEDLDPIKLSAMKSAFKDPKFEDVAVGDEAKENQPDKTTFDITTFEGFHYTIKAGEKNDLNELYLTYSVEGKFQEKREPGPEESDEEAKAQDERFAAELKRLQEKLAAEKALAGKIFKVRSHLVDSIGKKRSELLKEKQEIAPGLKELPGFPGGGAGSPLNLIPPTPKAKPEIKPEASPTEEKADKPKSAEKPDAKSTEAAPASKPEAKSEAKPKPDSSESPKGKGKGKGNEKGKGNGKGAAGDKPAGKDS